MRDNVKGVVRQVGLPRIIIGGFFLLLLFTVQCGIGLNFGISMGIVGGLLGGLIVIEWKIAEMPSLVAVHPLFAMWVAVLIAIVIGVVLSTGIGWLYGLLLNRVKGSEMTVTTYVGFSIIAFMNIVWTILPFKSGELIFPNAGEGLRNTIDQSAVRQGRNSHWAAALLFPDVPAGLAVHAFQNWGGDERGGCKPDVCAGFGYQCQPDAVDWDYPFHSDCRGGNPRLCTGVRIHAAV